MVRAYFIVYYLSIRSWNKTNKEINELLLYKINDITDTIYNYENHTHDQATALVPQAVALTTKIAQHQYICYVSERCLYQIILIKMHYRHVF